jgi:hypothetical protein
VQPIPFMKSHRRFIPPLVPVGPVAAASVCAPPIGEHLGSQAGWRLHRQLDEWENEGGSTAATDAATVLIVTPEDGDNVPEPASVDPQAGALDASRWGACGAARDLFPRNTLSDDVARALEVMNAPSAAAGGCPDDADDALCARVCPPMQRSREPCAAPFDRPPRELAYAGAPLSLPCEGLGLGREFACDAACRVDPGAAVSLTMEEALHSGCGWSVALRHRGDLQISVTMKFAQHHRSLALWERVGVRERSEARRHFIIRGGSARPMIVSVNRNPAVRAATLRLPETKRCGKTTAL